MYRLSILILFHTYVQFTDTEDKLNDIPREILSAVTDHCQCPLASSYITSGEFLCIDGDSTVVLYRAVLHVGTTSECTRVVSHVQDWTSSGEASIAIQGNRLRVDPDCMVEIESLTSETKCSPAVTVSQEESSGDNTGPIVGAAAGLAVLVVVIILAIVFFVFWLRRRGRFVCLHSEQLSIHPK